VILRDTGGSRRRLEWKQNIRISYVIVVAVVDAEDDAIDDDVDDVDADDDDD